MDHLQADEVAAAGANLAEGQPALPTVTPVAILCGLVVMQSIQLEGSGLARLGPFAV
jgi:hypothetical protein